MENQQTSIKCALPDRKTGKPPLLFVHGAWHGAWCWQENFFPFFKEQGYPVYAVDLCGHGDAGGMLWRRGIGSYVRDVENAVQRIVEDRGEKPILIGHSMGGLVVRKALVKDDYPGAVLLAPVPKRGALLASIRYMTRHFWHFCWALVPTQLKRFVNSRELCREAFFSYHFPEDKLEEYSRKIGNESSLAYVQMVFSWFPKKVSSPVMVLGAEKDMIFLPVEIRKTASFYGTKEYIFPNMAHDMMLEEGWENVAERIGDWVESLK